MEFSHLFCAQKTSKKIALSFFFMFFGNVTQRCNIVLRFEKIIFTMHRYDIYFQNYITDCRDFFTKNCTT